MRVENIGTIRAYLESLLLKEPPIQPKRSSTTTLSNVLHPEQTDRHDHRITDDALGFGTPSERYQNNIAAIRLLKQLESEERLATPEEQEILSRYVGWGGLADCFEETNRNYLEMKNLLREMKDEHILIFSTHILQLATDLCDEIVVLNHGQLEGVDPALIHTPEFEQRIVDILKDEGEEHA